MFIDALWGRALGPDNHFKGEETVIEVEWLSKLWDTFMLNMWHFTTSPPVSVGKYKNLGRKGKEA